MNKENKNIEEKDLENITIEEIKKSNAQLKAKIKKAKEEEQKVNPRDAEDLLKARDSLVKPVDNILSVLNGMKYEVDKCVLTQTIFEAILLHLNMTGYSKLGVLQWVMDSQTINIRTRFRRELKAQTEANVIDEYVKKVESSMERTKESSVPSYIR